MLFDVMRVIWNLNRAGVEATANKCSNITGMSTYRVRRIAHTASELELVSWVSVPHRPNVNKRSYYLTDTGRSVLLAYYGKSSAFKGGF